MSVILDKNGVNKMITRTPDGREFVLEFQGKEIDCDEYRNLKTQLDNHVPYITTTRDWSVTIPDAQITPNLYNVLTTASVPPSDPSVDTIKEMMKELNELKRRVNRTVALVHNCKCCGASLEVNEDKPIFHCRYCGATYLLGSVQPNSVYN